MPSAKWEVAREKMLAAEHALRQFIERPDRKFTPEELKEHRQLADRLAAANDEFVQIQESGG